ncbi:MAG: carboxymuconolactone decarboxylase family protein, partial [Alphaproteobacteria bacterium]
MAENVPYPDYQTFVTKARHVGAGLIGTGKPIGEADLDHALLELVKIRASQMNGCAFCLALHVKRAREAGVTEDQLSLLPVWRDTDVFSLKTRAALDWTEHLTKMAMGHVPDSAYQAMRRAFNEDEALQLTAAIATINAWNRICGGLRFPV